MMRMADETCDFSVVTGLCKAGHDVVSICEKMSGVSDEVVIALASSEKRLP